ncbi:alpha/beta hydrolase [Streptomyces sp. NPDC050610]|uniref:alpha/beta hydrolase n=1 Tax=Streptomyces sp. NPDC050610 TaxID=3157097 RepID=UPI00344A3E4B
MGIRSRNTAVCIALAAGLLAPGSPAHGKEPPAPSRRSSPNWETCHDAALDAAKARCADLVVPLDYAHPHDGRTVTLRVSRIAATDRAHRIGALLHNPGGPGSPGLGMPVRARRAMGAELAARFDLIGVDPRFIGRSSAADCRWKVRSWAEAAGHDLEGFRRSAARQRELAQACRVHAADALPYAGTVSAARDLDRVRVALGEERVSYLGESYGTYLGAVYAQLFPSRVDRLVLDAPVDPRRWPLRTLQGQAASTERALHAWAGWAARRDDAYGLGATRQEVLRTVAHIQRAAARAPLRLGPYTLGERQFPIALYALLADARRDPQLGEVLSLFRTAADGKPAPPPSGGAAEQLLRAMAAPPDGPTGADVLVSCADGPAPHDPMAYWRDVQRSRAALPVFGPLFHNILPCAFWPSPREPHPVIGNRVPALLIAATGDVKAAYSEGVALHGLLRESRLATLRARVHIAYGSGVSRCVDDLTNAYLASGELPRHDLRCDAGP